jgi:hypothetical protein
MYVFKSHILVLINVTNRTSTAFYFAFRVNEFKITICYYYICILRVTNVKSLIK